MLELRLILHLKMNCKRGLQAVFSLLAFTGALTGMATIPSTNSEGLPGPGHLMEGRADNLHMYILARKGISGLIYGA